MRRGWSAWGAKHTCSSVPLTVIHGAYFSIATASLLMIFDERRTPLVIVSPAQAGMRYERQHISEIAFAFGR
jgi:hypothetical protein